MITIVCSSIKPDKNFSEKLIKNSGIKPKDIEFLHYKNDGEYGLTELYNKALGEAVNDHIIFLHDDVLLGKNWAKKTLKHLTDTDYGIIGVAGSWEMPENGKWWTNPGTMMGQVWHKQGDKKWLSKYCGDLKNNISEAVVVDGVYFAVDRTKLSVNFNEEYSGFHFYDVAFSYENHIKGTKVGVIHNIQITHLSVGATNNEWEKHREYFSEANKETLPTVSDFKIINPEIKRNFKASYKVGVVILHKDKNDLLFQCIESFQTKSTYDNYKIYIGDTGSSEDKLTEIRDKYGDVDNIELINIGDYHFAKNNNDMVKDYVDADTNLILFCNNDIELVNDALTEMLNTYHTNKRTVGTIGARLHYGDKTIQHAGIALFVNKQSQLFITHAGLRSRYSYEGKETTVIGNTGGFLLVARNLFDKVSGFNEEYTECFEDVELNCELIRIGKQNITNGNAVCYHYESQTRNDSDEKTKRQGKVFNEILLPYINKNLATLSPYIQRMNEK